MRRIIIMEVLPFSIIYYKREHFLLETDKFDLMITSRGFLKNFGKLKNLVDARMTAEIANVAAGYVKTRRYFSFRNSISKDIISNTPSGEI